MSTEVTVKSFSSEAEAHLARTKLAGARIPATVHRFSRYRAMASGGYLLKVRAQDLKKAKAILDKINPHVDMDEYVDKKDDAYVRCPQCKSVNVLTDPLPGKLLWLVIALLGIPLLFMRRGRKCRKCGHTWRE